MKDQKRTKDVSIGPENAGPIMQRWKMQDWKMRMRDRIIEINTQ